MAIIALVAAATAGGWFAWQATAGRSGPAGAAHQAAVRDQSIEPPGDRTLAATSTPTATTATSPAATPPSVTPVAPAAAAAPAHFWTLPPGVQLPSSAQCATWVQANPTPENKRVNAAANQAAGHRLPPDFFPAGDDPRANTQVGVRVDGAFKGATQQILRWAACKWGIDEDMVYAQAAKESWWHQPAQGDWDSDPTACAPGHGLGVDGKPGLCPQSFGMLQNRYPYERGSWPGIATSTAMNADTAYAIWRACFEGYERWLNDVERGRQYQAGDAWGCVGRWFSGRWHTAPADQYMAAVQSYLSQRIWQQASFQEP